MAVGHLPGRSGSEDLPHDQAQVDRCGLNQIALSHILLAAKTYSSVLLRLADMGEGAFDELPRLRCSALPFARLARARLR